MPHDYRYGSSRLSRRTALRAGGSMVLALSWRPLERVMAQEAIPHVLATPTPSETDLTALIRETEAERLRALVDADMAVAELLHADDFQLVNPAGGTLTKDEYLGGIGLGALDYLIFEPVSEVSVRLYDQAAVIRYESQLQIVIDGQDMGLSHFWHTDLYEQREGRWQAVWSQATEIL